MNYTKLKQEFEAQKSKELEQSQNQEYQNVMNELNIGVINV